jgi:multiple sugar transport system permease protein
MSTLAVREADAVAPAAAEGRMSAWQVWGIVMIAPYILVFLAFVLYPVAYGLWTARHPQSYVHLWEDPIFARSVVNTLVFLLVGVNIKMFVALMLSGFFVQTRPWIRWLSLLFILPWAVPSIPTILSFRFMLNPEWGVINQLIFKFTADDGPNWLNDPTLALTLAILVHIWKSLPFWTLILIAGRLAIPGELYEAASVDGASAWRRFWHITLPGLKHVIIVTTLLTFIFTINDFNIVYVMTRGGPGTATQVFATYSYEVAFNALRWGRGVTISIFVVPLLIALIPLVSRYLLRERTA